MDKFCFSDASYHELAISSSDLPKKYLISQCRNDINNIFHIQRTPGNISEAYVNLKDDNEVHLSNENIHTA